MPERTSSNDLVLEQIREVLAERQKDLADGITPRSLNKRLESLEKDHEMRLRELEQHQARSEAHVDTARYIIPPTPAVGFPPATTVNVNGNNSRRPTITKGLKEAANNPFIKWIAVALAIAGSHLLARCGLPPIH